MSISGVEAPVSPGVRGTRRDSIVQPIRSESFSPAEHQNGSVYTDICTDTGLRIYASTWSKDPKYNRPLSVCKDINPDRETAYFMPVERIPGTEQFFYVIDESSNLLYEIHEQFFDETGKELPTSRWEISNGRKMYIDDNGNNCFDSELVGSTFYLAYNEQARPILLSQ